MDFFDVVNTTRAMRRLKPDDVSDDDLWTILQAAVMAPNGGNLQPWNFIVVRDAEKKRKIGEWYLEGWEKMYGPARETMLANPEGAKAYKSADHLARNIASVPVLIFATLRMGTANPGIIAGSSIYPAVQNLMLAARTLGLGTTLTTLHRFHEEDVRKLLGIPDGVETMAMIPIGWPKGKFGVPNRQPVEKVAYWEAWQATRERA